MFFSLKPGWNSVHDPNLRPKDSEKNYEAA